MRELLKRIAPLLPNVRNHVERVRSSMRQKEALARELAACKGEIESFKNRFNKTPVGGFAPDVRGPGLTQDEKVIVDQFSELYYRLGQQGRCTYMTSWLGYSTLKCPLDLWIYQELICKLRPEVIFETGTASGGSALFLASMCDLIGQGDIITIDIDERVGELRPIHPRLSYVIGSSTDPAVIRDVRKRLHGRRCGMVILDSDHTRDHVLAEMRIFQEFIPVGGYMIVEDTNINGHPSFPEFGLGPMEAVEDFLRETDAFQIDPACERFLLTMNPSGFLRRCK
jgi:cephalosporin hydroxylase